MYIYLTVYTCTAPLQPESAQTSQLLCTQLRQRFIYLSALVCSPQVPEESGLWFSLSTFSLGVLGWEGGTFYYFFFIYFSREK